MKRSRNFVILVMALVVLTAPTLFAQQQEETPAPEIATVVGVHDGDTITVEFPDGTIEPVRLIGVDTPEVKDPPSFYSYTQPYGREAKIFTQNLLMYQDADAVWHGRTVHLIREARDRDDFYRLLRHVYLVQEDRQELSVSEALLIAGLAIAKEYPPDTLQATRFAELDRQARVAQVGRHHSRKKKVAFRFPLPRAPFFVTIIALCVIAKPRLISG